MAAGKKPDLEVSCDGMTYRMEEVGSWSWQKGENGSITLTASPPGVEPVAAAGPAARRARGFNGGNGGGGGGELGKKLVGALTPTLAAKAEELKSASRASAEAARQASAEKAAEQEAATPTRGAPPEADQ